MRINNWTKVLLLKSTAGFNQSPQEMKVLIKPETLLPRPEVSNVIFHPHRTSSMMKAEYKW